MAVPLKKVLEKMTPERRARVEADAQRMIEAELRRRRKAKSSTISRTAKSSGR